MKEKYRESWEWLAFAASLPSDPIPISGFHNSGLVLSGRMIWKGISFHNSGGTSVTLQMLDGVDANGSELATFQIGATNTVNVEAPDGGVLVENGIWLIPGNATLDGALYVVHLWKYPFTPPGE